LTKRTLHYFLDLGKNIYKKVSGDLFNGINWDENIKEKNADTDADTSHYKRNNQLYWSKF